MHVQRQRERLRARCLCNGPIVAPPNPPPMSCDPERRARRRQWHDRTHMCPLGQAHHQPGPEGPDSEATVFCSVLVQHASGLGRETYHNSHYVERDWHPQCHGRGVRLGCADSHMHAVKLIARSLLLVGECTGNERSSVRLLHAAAEHSANAVSGRDRAQRSALKTMQAITFAVVWTGAAQTQELHTDRQSQHLQTGGTRAQRSREHFEGSSTQTRFSDAAECGTRRAHGPSVAGLAVRPPRRASSHCWHRAAAAPAREQGRSRRAAAAADDAQVAVPAEGR